LNRRGQEAGAPQYALQLRVRLLNIIISLQEGQEVFAVVLSFVHELVHQLHDVALDILFVDVLQVPVLSGNDQLPLVDLVEDEQVVAAQSLLNGGLVASQRVSG